jgi:hypothetical protein
MFHGVGLQHTIEAGAFASLAQEREQHVREGRDEQKPIATSRVANVGGGQAHAKVNVLGIAKGFLDAEASAVELHALARGQVGTARRKAPWILHPLVVHEYDRRNVGLILRHPNVPEHLGPAGGSEPLRSGPRRPSGVGNGDALTEPNHVIPSEGGEMFVALAVPKAPISKKCHLNRLRQGLMQPLDEFIFVGVAFASQR